ncbi:MAG: hypothetical protein ACYTGQ_02425 [Planctomycetota bacterium]|jgi:hypothetical protein
MNTNRYGKWLMCLALMLPMGCDDNEVQSYSIPKEKIPVAAPPMMGSAHSGHSGHGGPQQMFAAIVEDSDQFWFFKVTGDEHFLAPLKDQMIGFLETVSFKDGEPTWTVPDGWNATAGSGMRFATLHISDASHHVEMSVIPLPKTPILPQVNRWRGQLGLSAIDDAQLAKDTIHVDANGLDIQLFSLVGEGSGTMAQTPASGGGGGASGGTTQLPPDHPPVGGPTVPTTAPTTPSASSGDKPVSYTVPSGWEDLPATGMRVAALKVGGSELTIIPLAAGAGDLVANVNRWRGQVGLTPLDPAQIEGSCPEIQVDGAPARYVELVGMTGQSMLGLITIRGDKSWFVKLLAPTDVVTKETDNFKSFINSLTFN